ncbi:MAG: rod shape-determining protein RodA [Acidobacteriota bacterium]
MRRFSTPITSTTVLPEPRSLVARLGTVNWTPLAAALVLSVIGMATVHSASAELPVDYLPRQIAWVVIGLALVALMLAIDYHALVDQSPLYYGVSLALVVLVLAVGREIGGARSWIGIGSFGGQPAELAKIATALLLARQLSRAHGEFLSFKEMVIAVTLVGVPVTFIFLQDDMGSAAMFVPMAAAAMLVAGVRLRWLIAAGLLAFLLGAGFWQFGMQDYQRARVASFVSPESDPLGAGYQMRQSKIAVGSGQLVGRGYGQGTQSQLRFLPARHTDFTMAVLAEEWGFFGVVIVFGAYAAYLGSAVSIATRSRDRAAVLLIAALIALVMFHVLYNTAMVVGLMPITGIPLPFLSYGGSFMLINFATVGLLMSIDLRRDAPR